MYKRVVYTTEVCILRILLGIFSEPEEKSDICFIYMQYIYLFSEKNVYKKTKEYNKYFISLKGLIRNTRVAFAFTNFRPICFITCVIIFCILTFLI